MTATNRSLLRAAPRVLAALILAAPVLAGDYCVAATGSNANDGLSPATSWRNVSFAVDSVPLTAPGGVHVIHVGPGLYDAAAGESFPYASQAAAGSGAAAIELVADAGPAVTTIGGPGPVGESVVRLGAVPLGTAGVLASRIRRIEGFTIVPFEDGIQVVAERGTLAPVFRNLRLAGGSGAGLRFTTDGPEGAIHATVEGCEVTNFSQSGIFLTAFGDGHTSTMLRVDLVDTTVHGNNTAGLRLDSVDDLVEATVTGGSFLDNAFYGVYVRDFGSTGGASVELDGVLVAGNGEAGVRVHTLGLLPGPACVARRLTAAANPAAGLLATGAAPSFDVTTSIVHGNGLDLDGDFSTSTFAYTDVGSALPPGTGNLSLDPLFVDAASGDYRLQAGSPCVDAGDPLLAPDPDGTVAGMGAFPLDQDAVSVYCTASGKLCVKAPLQRVLPPKLAKATGAPPCTGTVSRNFMPGSRAGPTRS